MVHWKKLLGLGKDRNDFRDEMRRREQIQCQPLILLHS